MLGEADDSSSGSKVLDLFDLLRRQTLDVLDRAEAISREGGSAGERARPHIVAARRAVD